MAAVFKMECLTFQRVTSKFVLPFSSCSFKIFVDKLECKRKMLFLPENNCDLMYYKVAFYATNVMFHRSLRPCGSIAESRHYKS